MLNARDIAVFALPAMLSGMSGHSALAQGTAGYPSRNVQIVLAFAPGGANELEGRLFSQKLSENTGRNFILDFRPGASGLLAMNYVAKAAPDGHTILMGVGGVLTIPAAFNKELPYDPVKDIAPVMLIHKRPTVLLIHPSLPIRTAAEYIAYARAHPGELNYGTTGSGGSPHVAGEWLHNLTGTRATFVHYKGTGLMMPDLLAGRLQVTSTTLTSGLPYVKSGKLRLLGITTSQRSSLVPDVPTIAEQGVPGYDFSGWLGVVATGGTPGPIIDRLRTEFLKAGSSPEINKRLSDEGVIVVLGTTESFRQFLATETARWKKLVQDTGMKLEE